MKRVTSLVGLAVLGLLVAGCGDSSPKPSGGGSGSTSGGTGSTDTPKKSAIDRLNGGGSSFVFPLMSRWTAEYDKASGVKVNYQSIGSGAGIQQMTAQTMDFGCSDAPMNEEQLKKAADVQGDVIHVPLAMGAVVAAYNLEGVDSPLQFTGPVLADIFLGKIKTWNDPALAELNPDAKLPAQEISVVHRSDGSGTTYVFVDYLSKTSPEWKEKVGVGTSVNWPSGVGQKGNEGVAGQVKRTPGGIGYIELTYAIQNKISYAAIKNQEGEFVPASLESVTAAAEGGLADIPDDLRYSLTNAPGKGAYPISGTVWAVLYVHQAEDKGTALVDFLRWCATSGQEFTAQLHYARLPAGLVEKLNKKLDLVQSK